MNIVVFGATGGTGKWLVKHGLKAGHTVTVLARNEAKAASLGDVRILVGNARDLDSVRSAVVGQDAVVSALGGDSLKRDDLLEVASRNIIQAMKDENVKRLVVLGAAGALHDAQALQSSRRKAFFWFFSRTLLKHPLRDSAAQERQIETSGLEYTVVHPPRLLDEAGTGSYRVCFEGLPKGGYAIPREDVAQYMIAALSDTSLIGKGPYLAR